MNNVTNSELIEIYKMIDDYLKILKKEKDSYHEGE